MKSLKSLKSEKGKPERGEPEIVVCEIVEGEGEFEALREILVRERVSLRLQGGR